MLFEKKVSYRVENIARKGEIACYTQFLLFSQCFPQLYILSASNAALCGNKLEKHHDDIQAIEIFLYARHQLDSRGLGLETEADNCQSVRTTQSP